MASWWPRRKRGMPRLSPTRCFAFGPRARARRNDAQGVPKLIGCSRSQQNSKQAAPPVGRSGILSQVERTVDAFFESYRAAFERLDAPAIADHFAYPCHITSDTGEMVVLVSVTTKHEWIGKIEGLLAMYQAVGLSSARVVNLDATEISPRLVQTVVHWALYDNAAPMLYAFEAAYTLAHVDDGLRISAIAHNEMPRYRECLARLRLQRG